MVDLITEVTRVEQQAGSIYSMDTLDKVMLHILGGMERDNMRFYHATQNGVPFKTYELFVSGIFHLKLSDHG